MKTLRIVSLTLLSVFVLAITASPAFASGPFDYDWTRGVAFPLGTLEGMAYGFLHSTITALALAALGAIAVTFLPNELKRVSETAEQSPMPSLGVGCLTIALALPLFVLLVVLIITIPAAILLPFVLGIAWIMGWVTLGWLAGERLLQALNASGAMRTPVVAVVAGILLLALISAVPVIGWLIALGAGSLGLGAVILSRFGTRTWPTAQAPASAGLNAPNAPAE